MFTGIVQDKGVIRAVAQQGDTTMTIATGLPLHDVALGASIACNGVCLTVTDKGSDWFRAQLSAETLNVTTAHIWQEGTALNLERALRAGDELGGHYVSGHVDGIAYLRSRTANGDSQRLVFEAPPSLARFIAPKGSVTLDGVSLTVNEVDGTRFGVMIIPHTQKETTLGATAVGAPVNIEVDMIARYVARMMERAA